MLGGTRQQTRVKPAEQDVRTANINVMRAYLGELELVMHQAEEGPRAGNPDRECCTHLMRVRHVTEINYLYTVD